MSEKPSANVICHSQAPNGEELITMEIELHRFILPEFNTHRCFSRNFQSSRAVPVEKMIDQVRNNPALPVHWGKNQRGMVAEGEHDSFIDMDWCLSEYEKLGINLGKSAEQSWKIAATFAADTAESFNKAGYHKQVVNRLLEPFMWTKGVVTATREGFNSFFKLRSHYQAQPEIKALSDKMVEALESSHPTKLNYGEYHLPYIQDVDKSFYSNDKYSTENAIKISASCCAQVSYRALDDSLEKALKIYNMLNLPENGVYPKDPPHFSPVEHVAKVIDSTLIESHSKGRTTYYYPDVSGNFNSSVFGQYRKYLEIGLESEFFNTVEE